MIASRSIAKSAAILALAFTGLAAGRVSANTTLLDTFTGTSLQTFTSSTPHTYMGDGFTNNALPTTTTSFQITGVQMYVVFAAAATYTDVVGRIQFWNTANGGTTSATNPAFANAAGPLITADFGALSPTGTSYQEFSLALSAPITLTGGPGTNWGFAQNFQSSTTAAPTLADDSNLTSLITANSSDEYAAGMITTGTGPAYGYYRNVNSETNFNFTSTARSISGQDYQGIAIVLIGNVVPEPSSLAALAAGALALGGAAYRKRHQRV